MYISINSRMCQLKHCLSVIVVVVVALYICSPLISLFRHVLFITTHSKPLIPNAVFYNEGCSPLHSSLLCILSCIHWPFLDFLNQTKCDTAILSMKSQKLENASEIFRLFLLWTGHFATKQGIWSLYTKIQWP